MFRPNKKRQHKNEKFGFGGQKKRSKQNTKLSSDDVSSFSVRRNMPLPEKYKKRKQVCLNMRNNSETFEAFVSAAVTATFSSYVFIV